MTQTPPDFTGGALSDLVQHFSLYKRTNDHLLVYSDLLHPKCLNIQQGDTLGLRADSSDAFYFFGHCLFLLMIPMCVCRAKLWIVSDCRVCLEMYAVCERVCECCRVEVSLHKWRRASSHSSPDSTGTYICMCLINVAGLPYLPVLWFSYFSCQCFYMFCC